MFFQNYSNLKIIFLITTTNDLEEDKKTKRFRINTLILGRLDICIILMEAMEFQLIFTLSRIHRLDIFKKISLLTILKLSAQIWCH